MANNPDTMREFMQRMLISFPDAEVTEDAQGQLVIHTNLISLHDDPDDEHSTIITLDEFYPDDDDEETRAREYQAMKVAQYGGGSDGGDR